eukprot:TRINITY_DN12562_c0_g1_i1.p1 TRINITY_DN12562_c0_g1~~TRINITY_DN12562_c0_g1_i1.p1  ORF type:complete len:190 (-),score=25.45 TRINITY_DN12562_c0_g1_i1:276-794(-)
MISRSLSDLDKAQCGELLMSSELEELAKNIYENVVPRLWSSSAKSLTCWMKDLVEHIEFFNAWIEGSYPATYRIAAFSNPRNLLAAVSQNYARKLKLPLDEVAFENNIVEDEAESEDGIILSNLFIEGAKWEGHLADHEAGALTTPMPNVLFTPTESSKKKKPEKVVVYNNQ